MRIKVINPNTSESMTRKIGEAARAAAAVGTEIVACNPAGGPVSIEGHYDEAVSVLGLLDEVRNGEGQEMDGYVVACFGDPPRHALGGIGVDDLDPHLRLPGATKPASIDVDGAGVYPRSPRGRIPT